MRVCDITKQPGELTEFSIFEGDDAASMAAPSAYLELGDVAAKALREGDWATLAFLSGQKPVAAVKAPRKQRKITGADVADAALAAALA